jgi:anti-anti-sigma regulatory factor
MEFGWALAASVGVFLFGTLQGIIVAIVLSLVGLASQTAHPRVSVIGRRRGANVLRPLTPETADDETFDGLLIVRPEGRLFFVNAQNVADCVAELVAKNSPRVLALDLSRVPDVAYSALEMIEEGDRRMAEQGIALWLVGLNPGVLDLVRRAGLDARLGRDRLLFNARTAIERFTAAEAAVAVTPARDGAPGEHEPGGPHPIFATAPGDPDVLLKIMAIVLVGMVLMAGLIFFTLHTLPERLTHKSQKLQFEIVAVLGLLSLFTREHIFWVAGLLIAFVDLPDFSHIGSMARSLERMAGRSGSLARGAVREDIQARPLTTNRSRSPRSSLGTRSWRKDVVVPRPSG